MFERIINNKTSLILIVISSAFLLGILSFQHVYPGDRDFNLGSLQLIIISAGLALYISLSKYSENIRLSYMALFWLVFAAYLLIQSLFIDFDYIDEIYLLLGMSFFFFVLSIVITNLSNIDKQYLVDGLTSVLIIVCFLALLTQFGHLYQLTSLYGDLLLPIKYNGRPVGNIGQPNQLAYIYSLGLIASMYKLSRLDYSRSDHQYLKVAYYCVMVLLLGLGIALTASRGGIILFIFAISIGCLLFYSTMLARANALLVSSSLSMFGFFIGSYLLKVNSQTLSAVERIIYEENKSSRLYLLEQSWVIYKQHPVVGIGWGRYSNGVLENALELPWFTYSYHSHMIFSQIAAELGVIGLAILLIPLLIVIPFRAFHCPHPYQRIALACVLVTLLYSLSEYPLWYFVYLSLFVVFFSLIDFKLCNLTFNVVKKYIVVSILCLLCVYSFFGYKNYMKYSDVSTELMTNGDLSSIQKNIDIKLPIFFGLSKHRDKLLYAMAGTELDNIDAKLELGDKVLRYENTFPFLVKQANYYALANNNLKALELYKKACIYNFSAQCDSLQDRIETLRITNNLGYTDMVSEFQQWRRNNPEKSGWNKE